MEHSNRRQFLAGTALLGVAATASLNIQAEKPSAQTALPKLIHKVFFWLKNPDSTSSKHSISETW